MACASACSPSAPASTARPRATLHPGSGARRNRARRSPWRRERVAALHTLDAFAEKDVFHVVVESPRGSTVKLKWDPRLGAMSVSRPLNLGLSFPYDWGFVPSTEGPDGDPIDALVYWDVSSYPGVVIPCRAIGVGKVDQRGGGGDTRIRNDRIVAVPIEVRREHVSAP